MKKILTELQTNSEDVDKKIELLEVLEEFLENLDNAVDFHTIGGYQYIMDLINSVDKEEIIFQCLSLLGTSSQNQPKVQKILVEANLIPQVMDFIKKSSNMKLKTKAIRCISCMITNYEAGSKVFLFNNGLNILKTILFDDSITHIPLLQKTLILLKDLAFQETMYLVCEFLFHSFVAQIPFKGLSESTFSLLCQS